MGVEWTEIFEYREEFLYRYLLPEKQSNQIKPKNTDTTIHYRYRYIVGTYRYFLF
jgi:hypothetical protein